MYRTASRDGSLAVLKRRGGCAIVSGIMSRQPTDGVPATPPLLRSIGLIALAVSFAVRLFYLFMGEFNEDEMNTLQMAWQFANGVVPYLDTAGFRPPWSFFILRPLFAFFDRPTHIIWAARAMQLALSAAGLGFYFLFVDRLAGRRAAWWSLIAVSCFDFFVVRTTQVRAEPLLLLLLFAALYLFARWRADAGRLPAVFFAGLLLGAAVVTKYSAPFVALAPGVVLVIDAFTRRGRRRESLFAALLLAGGAVVAIVGTMMLASGGRWFAALKHIWLIAHGLRITEGQHGTNWFVLSTFITNPLFWMLAVVGFVYGHVRLAVLWRRRQPAWPVGLLLLLGWFSLAMILVRKSLFQQDLILPGLLLTPLAAMLLVRRIPLPLTSPRRRGGAVAILVAVMLVVPLLGGVAYERFTTQRTIGYYTEVVAHFWNARTPPAKRVAVDTEQFLAFLEGEHDWIHYYPVRSFRQSLALTKRISELTDPGEYVLSQAGHGIVRPEPLRVIKTQVVADLLKFDPKGSHALCRALRPFMPGMCDPTFTPGRRALTALEQHPPRLIVFSYAVADLVAKQPETRAWVAENYRVWFEPATLTFFGKPREP
ncbi:MAG: glycosyltransferase family 39 protein [Candidatus Lernaella stagnicola]|nr:glycosyltransferase family 39 protein [Candidatus Lernaella stagnicola]